MVFATVQTVPITVVHTCCVNGEPVLTRGTRTISSPSFRTQRSCGRRPILSLINVPNNRGATWLQHGNSLGNWSERWRDFGYIERVCSSRAWNKFPFASSLSISFFSSFPPLCSDRSSFRIRLLPRILRISVFLYSNPWDVRIFIKEETIRTILVNEKHGRKRKSWTLFN